ncbi:hypothetical protein [Methylobacterium durans]|uniref:Uncharacterized protein n=1 Tax=Methylobacterium durans TaxID=2202825 RepID=A0A2U8W4K0_9HYPH|nr:hypothetical protein [Methylobacterium durans]AWN40292.1 hypothetical protein DK389_06760 [Methylobacterium durans]
MPGSCGCPWLLILEVPVKLLRANRIVAASLAEVMADELAAAAHAHRQEDQLEAADGLLDQARHHRVQAIRLRAQAGAEDYMRAARLR